MSMRQNPLVAQDAVWPLLATGGAWLEQRCTIGSMTAKAESQKPATPRTDRSSTHRKMGSLPGPLRAKDLTPQRLAVIENALRPNS